jgi:hypothetical protein
MPENYHGYRNTLTKEGTVQKVYSIYTKKIPTGERTSGPNKPIVSVVIEVCIQTRDLARGDLQRYHAGVFLAEITPFPNEPNVMAMQSCYS